MQLKKIIPHFIITAITFLIVIVIIFIARPSADPPTPLSAANMLKMSRLDSLPEVWTPSGSGDAAPIYQEFLTLCAASRDALASVPAAPQDLLVKLSDLLVRAKDCPQTTAGFGDTAALEPGAIPDYADAPRKAASQISEMVVKQIRANTMTPARAQPIVEGLWALGQRLFMNNVRSFTRYTGLSVMHSAFSASGMIRPVAPAVANAMGAWIKGIEETEKRWMDKKALFSTDASVSDLQRIADLDEDRTFRVEAILYLGIVRWTRPITVPNQGLIAVTLDKYAHDTDPMFAGAAKVAKSSTRESVRKYMR